MSSTVQKRLQRFPGGSVTAREFSAALIQELDRVNDLEPVFYIDFNGFLQHTYPDGDGSETGVPSDETSSSYVPTLRLTSSDFTLRMLKLLRRRGTFDFSIPDVSPLVELDELTIAACEAETRSQGLKYREEQAAEDGDGDVKPKDEAFGNKERARHFEVLERKLTERWESQVTDKWLGTQPLYFNMNDNVQKEDQNLGLPPHLRGDETRLQYFSHVDILTFCILDLFKCASASGPGGNTGDWTPYEAMKGSSDALSKPGTLDWQRLLMFVAECSPSLGGADASLEGVRVFYPPQSATLHPRGVAHTRQKNAPNDVSHNRFVDLGRIVQTAELKRQHVVLSAAPRDGSGCEMLHFMDSLQRCTRTIPIPSRWGTALCFESVPEAGLLALAFVSGVYIIDIETALPRAFLKESETVTALRWVPAMKALCVGSRVGNIRVYRDVLALERGGTMPMVGDASDPTGGPSASQNTLPHVDKLLHTDAITFIHATLLLGGSLVSSSLDGRMSLWNCDTGYVRYLDGGVAAFGFDVAESLSQIFAFGVDMWPFVYTYDVPNSMPLSLFGGGTVIGNSKGNNIATSFSPNSRRKVRPHTSKIVSVATLRHPKNAAISIDQNGGVRIWDLWYKSMIQAIEISRECPNPQGSRWGSLGHFPGLLYDPERGRISCYIRRFCITMDYNFKDDLLTTRSASFQPIIQLHYCSSNRTLVTFTSQALTVWSMATGQKLHSLSIDSLFLSITGEEVPTSSDELLAAVESDRRLPGLDIACVQVLDDSRTALVGLKGGGLVMISLGNASVICYVPPVPTFSGGDGLFITGDVVVDGDEAEPLTTIESIAATAVVGGDLRTILYIPSCDTLFMSGAGRTFFEFHGRRRELLARNNVSSIDATALLFHSYCGLLVIAEDSGELSLWTQHDAILNPDSWFEVAHLDASPLEGVSGMAEVPNTPSLLVYDSKGNVTLWDIVMELSIARTWRRRDSSLEEALLPNLPLPQTIQVDCSHGDDKSAFGIFDLESNHFDPTFGGYYYWPGAFGRMKEMDLGASSPLYATHPRFASTFEGPCERKEFNDSDIEINRLFKKVGLPRELHILNKLPLFDDNQRPPKATDHEKASVVIPQMSMVYLRRVARKRPDIRQAIVETIRRVSGGVESRFSTPLSPEELDKAATLPTKCNGFVQLKLRQHWAHTIPTATQCTDPGSTKASKRRRSSSRVSSYDPTTTTVCIAGSPEDEEGMRLPLNSRPPPKGHSSQRLDVGKSMNPVTSGTYEPRYNLLYCGDVNGRVAIYDLTFAVASPSDLFRVWCRELNTQRQVERKYAAAASTYTYQTTSGVTNADTSKLYALLEEINTYNPICDAFGTRKVLCIQNVQISATAAPITSVKLASSPYPYVITSDSCGFVTCWTLYLNTQCGIVSIGEESCLSPLRYATITIDSPIARRVYQHIELEDEEDVSSVGELSSSASFCSSKLSGRRTRQLDVSSFEDAGSTAIQLPSLATERVPLLLFPQQVHYQVPSAVDMQSRRLIRRGNGLIYPMDMGWASQVGGRIVGSLLRGLGSDTHSDHSPRGRRAPKLNELTRATQDIMTDVLVMKLAKLCKLANVPVEDESEVATELSQQMTAITGSSAFAERELEKSLAESISSINRMNNVKKPKPKHRRQKAVAQEWQEELNLASQYMLVTKGGVERFYCKEEGRMGIYDDIPQPYNRLGPIEVHQLLPTFCLSLMHIVAKDRRSVVTSSVSNPSTLNSMSSALNLMTDLNKSGSAPGLQQISRNYEAMKPPLKLEGVEAVVKYKEWYLGSISRLEALGRQYNLPDLTTSSPLPPIHKSPSRNTAPQPQYRLSEALSLFHNMYSVGVGDEATLKSSPNPTTLPPLRSQSVPLSRRKQVTLLDESPPKSELHPIGPPISVSPVGIFDVGRRAREERAKEEIYSLARTGANNEDDTHSSDDDVKHILGSLNKASPVRQAMEIPLCTAMSDFTSSQLTQLSRNEFKSYMNHCTTTSNSVPKPKAIQKGSSPTASSPPSSSLAGFQGSKPLRKSPASRRRQ